MTVFILNYCTCCRGSIFLAPANPHPPPSSLMIFFVCVPKFVHKSHASQWFPTTLCGARFKDTHLKDIFICKHRIRIPGELNNQSFIRYQIKSKENVLYDNLFMGLNFWALQYPLASTHKHIQTHRAKWYLVPFNHQFHNPCY